MKKVDKIPAKKDNGQIQVKTSDVKIQTTHQNLSPEIAAKMQMQKLNAAVAVTTEVLSCIGNFFSYLEERERTKQVIADAQARIEQARINLERTKIEESTKRAEIMSEHQQKMAEIESVRIKIATINKAIDDILETIKVLREKFQEKENLEILSKLHDQQIKLIEVAKSIAEM